MKNKLVFLFFLNVFNFCSGQIINFPDVNFKNKLLSSNISNIAYSCCCSYINIDANNNGEIEVSEAQAVCRLYIPTSSIEDLTGIEYFTNLKILDCGQNNLNSMNVSQLTQLEQLACYQNGLTTINLNGLDNLWLFLCQNNQITSLDFTNNSQLRVVYCGNNQLSTLDFMNNPLFNDLGCRNNPNLTTVKIKNGTTQLFGNQTVYNECWTGNPNLTTICADDNEIPALQSYLANCAVSTTNITINSNCLLENEELVYQNVFVYPNPVKNSFTIENLTDFNDARLQFYTAIGQLIYQTECTGNPVDISHFATGNYIVKLLTDKNIVHFKIIKE